MLKFTIFLDFNQFKERGLKFACIVYTWKDCYNFFFFPNKIGIIQTLSKRYHLLGNMFKHYFSKKNKNFTLSNCLNSPFHSCLFPVQCVPKTFFYHSNQNLQPNFVKKNILSVFYDFGISCRLSKKNVTF